MAIHALPASTGASGLDVLMIGFVGGTGGASILMRELALGLARRGVRAGLAVPAWDTVRPYAAECRDRGIPVIETPWLQEREPRSRAYLDALQTAVRLRAPIVHYHLSTNVMPGRYVRPVRLFGARPSFVTLHDPYDEPPAGSRAAQRWAEAAPRMFERVIGVSRAGCDRQIRYGVPADRVCLVYNGVDLARAASGRAERARGQIGVDASARLVLTTARLAPQKRPLDALAAFERIAAEYPDTHLVMLGDGPLRSAVRERAANGPFAHRVHTPGHQADVSDWLAAASIWLLATESEGLSLAVLEAMASGLPIVTTNCPGNDELLAHEETALLTPIGDPAALAAALRRLLEDAALARRLGARAVQAAARFSLERTVDEYLHLYREAARRARPAHAGQEAAALAPAAQTRTGARRSA